MGGGTDAENAEILKYNKVHSVSFPKTHTYDTETIIPRPVRKGYTFAGWTAIKDYTFSWRFAPKEYGTKFGDIITTYIGTDVCTEPTIDIRIGKKTDKNLCLKAHWIKAENKDERLFEGNGFTATIGDVAGESSFIYDIDEDKFRETPTACPK